MSNGQVARGKAPAVILVAALATITGLMTMFVAAGCGQKPAVVENPALAGQSGENGLQPEDAGDERPDDPSAPSSGSADGATQGTPREPMADSPSPPQPSGTSQPAGTSQEPDGDSPDGNGAPQNDTPPQNDSPDEESDPQPVAVEDDFPFANRLPIPEFPKDAEWLNTGGPLRKQDLKGKFVLLDFWTYCCINCIHILPELKKLERKYPNELVVIGVHSAKFETEKDSKNIEEAILRYEIEHPVVNDKDHAIWNSFGVRSWPTVLLIDPQGNAVWGRPGEIKFEQVDAVLQAGLPWYRERGHLDPTPIRFELLANRQKPTPLRFPGKVLADEAGKRLFITDSNHNRIVVSSLDGTLIETIGSGKAGRADGGFQEASFDHPHGVALHGDTLYVADTENHLLRKVDLKARVVSTIAGVGSQARVAWPGLDKLPAGGPFPDRWVGPPKTTGLNSPWALWVHDDDLYIAMAGPHQIWKMPLDESEIGPYAGNGREDIVDGPLLPDEPYALGYSSFAQPSGLSGDGTWLYVADSEGSSIRAVPFDPQGKVRTVVGTSELPYGRLFEFGDQDGERKDVKLQHALGVAYHDGRIYVADTYNNKIKVVDAETGETRTVAGTGEPGLASEPAQFDEPAGISYAAGTLYVADTNNHAIRTINVETGKVGTLEISGLKPAAVAKAESKPNFEGAKQVAVQPATVQAKDGQITLNVRLTLPLGYKINPDAPMSYFLEFEGDSGPVDRKHAGRKQLDTPAAEFPVLVPVGGEGQETVRLSMNYYYCQEGGEGLCKIGSVVFTVPLKIDASGDSAPVALSHQVD